MRKMYYLLFMFILNCSIGQINYENLATDGQIIWCLSQEEQVEIGSIAVATGWPKISDKSTGEKWDESFVDEAKEYYKTLITTIEYYEYLEPNKTHPDIFVTDISNTKSDHKRWLISIYKDGELYGNQVDLFFSEMKSIKTDYESDRFFLEDKDYNEALKENRRVDYVNSHSICKIWYEANN